MVTTVVPLQEGAVERVRARADRAWDVAVVVAVNALVIVGMWLRHGQLDAAGGPGGALTAAGQLTALLGTYAVLLQLVLMSRLPWVEKAVGFDRMTVWHRITGTASVVLISAHLVFTLAGYAQSGDVSLWDQLTDFLAHYPDVLMATVGFVLLLAVAVTSMRAARRRLDREAWHFVHLYSYLAIALSFAHQLAVGSDFTDDAVARLYWSALTAAAVVCVLWARVGQPIALNLRHRFVVDQVRRESRDTVSIYIGGRDLDQLDVRPGQFFLWRFLTRDGWFRANPFSISAGNDGRHLRITVKALGDTTARLQKLKPRTKVFAEGPYGVFTTDAIADRAEGRGVLLIAGGIGITPMRAMLEELYEGPGDVVLLFRVAHEGNLVLLPELEAAAAGPNVRLHVLVDPVVGDDQTDQLGIPALRRLVPDIAEREVFLCGPRPMADAVEPRLWALGVPPSRTHVERFDY